jgi:hypothetical protein
MRNLVGIDDEIFAQYRQGAGGPCLAQVVVRALEKLDVGKYGEAGCAMRGVRGGDLNRVEVLAYDAFGRRGLFNLGNNGRLALRNFFFNGFGKAAKVLAAFGLAQNFGFAAHLARRRHFAFFGFEYGGEHVVHGFSVRV